MRVFIFTFLLAAGIASAADFRSVNWGDPAEIILVAEGTKPVSASESELVFSLLTGEKTLRVVYQFKDNKLEAAHYQFVHPSRETLTYISDYDSLQGLLVQKYGTPSASETRCDDDFYRDYPERWGMALISNKLSRSATWETPTLKIRHLIYAQPNGRISHTVEYSPVKSVEGANPFQDVYEIL